MSTEDRIIPGAATYNLLFVCTGNTCRSPMAEALARREVEERGWSHVSVASAGVAAAPGLPASQPAIHAIAAAGLDLTDHRSRRLDSALLDWADVVLAMSRSHLAVVQDMGAGHKAALLGDFAAGAEGAGHPISDPFGGDLATYESTLHELGSLVHRSLDRITSIVRP